MNKIRSLLIAGALVPAFALGACEDEKTAQAPSPPPPAPEAPAQPVPPEKPAAETAKEGLDKLREAAEKATKDLQPTLDKARDAANQALKDAQPAIDEARKAAEQLGASVGEIVKNAQDDFKQATEQLEKRLNELQGGRPVVTGDPAAALSPPEKLRTDTRAAAKAAAAGVGPAYVGVWTVQGSDCAKVDQEALEIFAVITPTTIRRYESMCNMPETPLTNGGATVDAECVAEGDVGMQTLLFSLPSPYSLTISGSEGAGVNLVRCHLPG